MQQVHEYLETPFMSSTGDKDTAYMYKAYLGTIAWTHCHAERACYWTISPASNCACACASACATFPTFVYSCSASTDNTVM